MTQKFASSSERPSVRNWWIGTIPMWRSSQLLCPFQLRILELGSDHRMDSGTSWTHCEMDLRSNSIEHLTFVSPNSKPQGHFGSPGINVSSEPVPSKL